MLQVVYTGEEAPKTVSKSLFLAGPSPRGEEDLNWRPEAIRILEELGYDGVVYAPIWREGVVRTKLDHKKGYDDQVGWETKYLNQADVIVFWVPRDLKSAPAFTTNVEWGLWAKSGKVVLGYPPEADKMTYLRWWADKEGAPVSNTLQGTLQNALDKIGEGSPRTGGERDVPLHLWNKPEFQAWLKAQKAVGNRLDGAEVVWTFRVGKKRNVFLWALHCNVWIESEGRAKTNEVVVFRPDISAIVAYCPPGTIDGPLAIEDTEVVIVREFRSPANNAEAMVFEIPGGSSHKPGEDPLVVASDEMEEETGLSIPADRFKVLVSRQIAATLAAHKSNVYTVELTPEEMLALKWEAGKAHGVHEDSEYTYVEVKTVREILAEGSVDWANVGMILQTLHRGV